MKSDSQQRARAFGFKFGDPYILGTQEPDSRPYNPTALGKDFAAFCKMHGFKCTFHDLRHTFATMMITNGCDVRTVASYLGHSSVSMTLNIYADVDPDAKRTAVSKVEDSFDFDADSGVYTFDCWHVDHFLSSLLESFYWQRTRTVTRFGWHATSVKPENFRCDFRIIIRDFSNLYCVINMLL